jgi:beta-glucosidase
MTLLPELPALSLAQQVAQMVVVRASGYLFDPQIQYPIWEPPAATLQHWVQDLGVGGVILLGGSAAELALRSQQLQTWAAVPLLIAADVEEGVGQRFSGATWFPPPMALNAIAQTDLPQAEHYAKQLGAAIAQEALAVGINWVLAPVVDVNNNPHNPVINVRAFGETTPIVSRLITAFLQGAQSFSVLTAAKHFPGHGDTAIDSHLTLPTVDHSMERLQQVELPPFQAAIAAGVDAVMSAHLQVPALDAVHPATLSPRILTQLLRKNLGFQGLIVTDALVMGAIADRYGANEAAVLAVQAGADILLMPADPAGAIAAVCAAVAAERISPAQIQASVARIWQAKQKACSAAAIAEISAQTLTTQLSQPDAIALTTKILQASQQVHSNKTNLTAQPHPKRNLIVMDEALNGEFLGRHTPAIAIPEHAGYQTQIIDRHTPTGFLTSATWQPTLLQLFIRGNPFRGSAGLTEAATGWFDFLVESKQLCGLLIYGSPYLLEQFLPKLPKALPYVFTYGQMPAAQAIALDALFDQSLGD